MRYLNFFFSEKYLHGGIFYKFVYDHQNLYGGNRFAIKSADHEVKSLNALSQCSASSEFEVPLMVYITYYGFVLLALAQLPISEKTLCYGTSNAGKTIHSTNQEILHIMKKIGEEFHLQPRQLGDKWFYGPGTFPI